MLIFKNKQNTFNDLSLINNKITEKNLNIQTKSEIDEYNKIIFFPLSSKEWSNIVYSFNKSYIKSLVSYDAIVNKLFKSYYNMLQYKPKNIFKRRRDNKIRYSANRFYISKSEINHTNTEVFFTLHGYNKQKVSFEKDIIRMIILSTLKKNLIEGKTVFVSKYKNRLIHLLKNNFFIFRKWNTVFFKTTDNLLGYLLINVKKRYLKSYNIPTYNIRLLKKITSLQKLLLNSIKSAQFNIYKSSSFKLSLYNLGLVSLLEKLYNKNVNIKLIELKELALNSDLFSYAVALKLRDRKNKAVSILRKAILQMVRIPDSHTLITFDDNTEAMNKNNIINTIKQQVVSGVRFEAAGRLTRRLTAMRSVFKYRYAGSLKDIRSSFNNKSSTILRGYAKSNSQYTLINSKTRNGTFGLKGWISSHTFMIYLFSFMLLSSLLLTPLLGIIARFIDKTNEISLNSKKFRPLATYVLNYMKSLIILFIFVFIPLSLEWNIIYFCILLLLTLGSIISLLFTYNSSNFTIYNNVDMLAIFAGFYEYILDITIAHSPFNDVYLFVNTIIGLSMIMVSLLKSNKSISIKKQILFILNNKKSFFIFYLVMFLSILIINIVLLQIGLGIIVDTSSTTLFFYTYFSKLVSIRLTITAILFYTTNKLTLDNLSLSIFSVIIMFLFGSVNYYIVMPYVKFVMLSDLIKIVNIISSMYILVEDLSVRGNHIQSLKDGIYNIIKKFPMIGRYLSSFNINNYYHNKSGLFLSLRNNGVIKNKISVYPLKTISKFTKIGIPSIVNTFELDCSFKGSFSNLKVLVKNNTLYFANFVSKLVPKSLNFACKINLTCADQVVIIDTNFKNGQLENLYLHRNNLDFANSKPYENPSTDINFGENTGNSMDSLYHPSQNTRELLRLTKPDDNEHNLQVFMEGDFNGYNHNYYGDNHQRNSHNNGYYIQESVSSTERLDSNLNDEMVYPNDENMVDLNASNVVDWNNINMEDWNNINMEDLNASNVIDWNNVNMENWNNIHMGNLNASNVIDWNHVNMENANNPNMAPYLEVQQIHPSIQEISYNNHNIQETPYYPDNNNLNYYHPNVDNLNNNFSNYHLSSPNMIPYLEAQQINPSTVQIHPNTQHISTSSEQIHPTTQVISTSAEQIHPNTQDISTSTGQINFVSQENISYLIRELKIRIQDLFTRRASRNLIQTRCVFKDIGIVFRNGEIVDGPSRQSSHFSTILRGASLHEPVWGFVPLNKFQEISTRSFYNNLQNLSTDVLTTDQIRFIHDELESKISNIMNNLNPNQNPPTHISFSNINIYCSNLVITETNGNVNSCLFTCLLERLYKENPQMHLGAFDNRNVLVLIRHIKTLLEDRT